MAGRYTRPGTSQAVERGSALAAAIEAERRPHREITILGLRGTLLGVFLAVLVAYIRRAGF